MTDNQSTPKLPEIATDPKPPLRCNRCITNVDGMGDIKRHA